MNPNPRERGGGTGVTGGGDKEKEEMERGHRWSCAWVVANVRRFEGRWLTCAPRYSNPLFNAVIGRASFSLCSRNSFW